MTEAYFIFPARPTRSLLDSWYFGIMFMLSLLKYGLSTDGSLRKGVYDIQVCLTWKDA